MSDAVHNDRERGVRSNVKLTYDDYLRMPADGLRHELIGGVHFVAASPNLRHQRISANDPFRDCVEVYRSVDAGRRTVGQLAGHADEAESGRPTAVYVLKRVLSREAGDVLTTSLLPGAEFPLSAVFPA